LLDAKGIERGRVEGPLLPEPARLVGIAVTPRWRIAGQAGACGDCVEKYRKKRFPIATDSSMNASASSRS
jgi:hypothetical protein